MDDFISIPNLPGERVSLAVVDARIPFDIEKKLCELEINLIKSDRIEGLYEAVAYHPDIMLHHLGGKKIVSAPNTSNKILYKLEDHGFEIIMGNKTLGTKYPEDIAYNAARVGNFLVCSMKFIDEVLLENAYEMGLTIIDVNQGYAKCSICVVDENAVITSDIGIYRALGKKEVDCLLIGAGEIGLFNMNYGFIGGASGIISSKIIAFYGNLSYHTDYEKMNQFILKYRKNYLNLSENMLNDYGTLIPLKEYSILTK